MERIHSESPHPDSPALARVGMGAAGNVSTGCDGSKNIAIGISTHSASADVHSR